MRLISVVAALCACVFVFAGGASAAAATFYVSTASAVPLVGNSCAMPSSNSVQAAVTMASAGDTVVVCDGVYTESVTITKNLTLVGSGNSVIQAPTTFGGGDLVTVTNGASVAMSGFLVSGPGPAGCASIQAGIRVRDNAILDLSNTTIRDIRDVDPGTGSFSGCQ